MKSACLGLAVFCAAILAAGCEAPLKEEPWTPPPRKEKDYSRALPPGELALRKIPPEQYPDFSRGFYEREGLERAIRYSLDYLSRPSSQRFFPYGEITHARAVASLNAFLQLLQTAQTPEALDEAIRRDFDVYQSVGWDDAGTVLFTGYYTPIFEGRLKRQGPFRYPLHALPTDLVKDEAGKTLGRRLKDGSLGPYYTRREILEGGALRGLEIAWLRDPFEAYIATVQGSVRLRLEDGSIYEMGYAGNNGYSYTSIGQLMIADGVIRKDELSLPTLRRYFQAHADKVAHYCNQNDRYIFFQPQRGGPFGSINVPVTPYRSLATDKEVFPRACLAYIETTLPRHVEGAVQRQQYAGFALDQDTGGAIRAAGRCDVYFGIGPSAEALAGRTMAEGRLYYLFVRPPAEARRPVPGRPAAAAGS